MTRRTTTRHPTEQDARVIADIVRRELRGYDPIIRVWYDGTAWVVDLDINDSCD